MKHFDYTPLYEEIYNRQKQELVDALQKFPNHEFHFGMDYDGAEQRERVEYPYIIGYLGDEPADLKVMAIKEENGFISILAKDEEGGFEETITNLKLDIILGHLENILDELPNV